MRSLAIVLAGERKVTRAALAAIRVAFHHNVGLKAAASLAVVSLRGRVSNAIELWKRVTARCASFNDRFVASVSSAWGRSATHGRSGGSRPRLKLPTFRGQFQTGTMALGGLCHGTQGTQAPYPGIQA